MGPVRKYLESVRGPSAMPMVDMHALQALGVTLLLREPRNCSPPHSVNAGSWCWTVPLIFLLQASPSLSCGFLEVQRKLLGAPASSKETIDSCTAHWYLYPRC